MSNHTKKEDECTIVHYNLCNGIKKKVLAEQKKYFDDHSRYLSYSRAITRLIERAK